jgi:hypothetical protein
MKWFSFFKPFSFERYCRLMFAKKNELFTFSYNFPDVFSKKKNLFWEVKSESSHWIGQARFTDTEGAELSLELDKKGKFFSNNRAKILKEIPLLFLCMHNEIEKKIDQFKPQALSMGQGVTTQDLQNESRSLVWLQTSLRVLKAALDKCEKDPSLAFQGFLQLSTHPFFQIRLIIFNLDLTLFFHEDQSLEVIIFDDKSKRHGEELTPSLKTTIKSLKAPFLNELIPLMSQWMKVASHKTF